MIGFAAETEALLENAAKKRTDKGCDWIVANDVSAPVFGADKNRVSVVTDTNTETWPELTKTEVGERLALRISQALEIEP